MEIVGFLIKSNDSLNEFGWISPRFQGKLPKHPTLGWCLGDPTIRSEISKRILGEIACMPKV